MKKQAILIMAHKNMGQLERLVKYFDGRCDIFIHVDRKCSLTDEDCKRLSALPGVVKVLRKISLHWASFSILKTQLLLLETALQHSDFGYVHLLSGQDYPLKPLSSFLDFFASASEEFCACRHLPHPGTDGNTLHRIQYFFPNDYVDNATEENVARIWKFSHWQKKIGIRRSLPRGVDHIYAGSGWFSITHGCVEKIVRYTHEHPSLYRRMRFTFAPDEIYLNTLVYHVTCGGKDVANDNYRYIRWAKNGDNHPVSFVSQNFYELAETKAFFARKVESPKADGLMQLIDRYLLRKDRLVSLETGAWNVSSLSWHSFDHGLAEGLLYLCRVCSYDDVVDLGCGPGWYVRYLRQNLVRAFGYDGNPFTGELSECIVGKSSFPCERQDLTEELAFSSPFDLCLLISVGEYIPGKYMETLIRNVSMATSDMLVVKWASKEKKKHPGVVNLQSKEHLLGCFEPFGLLEDKLATAILREYSWDKESQNDIFVLRKKYTL